MCPSDHMPDHDPSNHFDPSISSDKIADELNAADPERLAQITNCGIAIREFLLSKVSRMDNGVMYGGFVMAIADIFPESFYELARDVALLRSQLPDAAARSLPARYVTAQDIRNGRACDRLLNKAVLTRTGLGGPLTAEMQAEVRRYTWGQKVRDLRKKLDDKKKYSTYEDVASIEATINDVIAAGVTSWGIGWFEKWEKEVAATKAEISAPDKSTPTSPKPTPGPFDKFNTAYPDRWPFGCDPTLCMIFHDLVTARHYTTSFTDVTPNVIIKRIHWALNNCRRSWASTDHPQGWSLPWTTDEMRRTLDEMFKISSLPPGIQKNLCSLAQIFDIYLAQQDTITKLRKYDMDIANARSSKDRIVARDEKFILWVSSNKSWGDDWTKLFEYDAYSNMPPFPQTTAAKEDAIRAPIDDISPGRVIEREPVEPHLLSDADRDAMIPKQTPYDPNA